MVKRSLWKSTVREIFRSPGRYFAILGIIMLGAGFFVGLRVTHDAMIITADDYLARTKFFDYQLVSTLGFAKDAPEKLKELSGAEAVEGAFQQDALVAFTQDDLPVRFLSLPAGINLPELTSGRLPQQTDEILLDASAERSVALGDEIVLSDLNPQETLDLFGHESYIVVGFATSPLYLNYERGSTKIGSGSINCFAYLLPEEFQADYYTSLYVRGGDLGSIYTDEYKAGAELLELSLDGLAEKLADERYRAILKENTDKLNDAEAEYRDGRDEYRTERADAERQLAQADITLTSLEGRMKDGRRSYERGKKQYEDAKADALSELDEAEGKLNDAVKVLAEKEQEYAQGLADYQAGEAAYSASLSQLTSSADQYSGLFALYEKYIAFRQAYADVRDTLAKLFEEYTDIALDLSVTPAERTKKVAELWAREKKNLKEDLTKLISASRSLADALEKRSGNSEALKQFRARIDQLEKITNSLDSEEMSQAVTKLFSATQDLMGSTDSLVSGLSSQVSNYQNQIAQARAALAAARNQLNAAKAQLEEGRSALDAGWEEYFAGVEELNAARTEAEEQFASVEQTLADSLAMLDAGDLSIAAGREELEKARQEAADGFAEAEEELADARRELDDGWNELGSLEEPTAYLLGRGTNVGYACLENDSQIVSSIAKVFPVFFFLVAALICVTTMTRMVEEQRGQIGVLSALGYGRAAIMNKFLFYAGSAAFLGCGIGIPFFSYLFPQIIWQAYRIMYSFSKRIVYYLDWPLYGIITGLYVAAMLLVTYLALRGKLNDVPAALLRPKAPKLGKRVLLERIPLIWNHLSFMWKVTMRNIFRYKNRVMMMLLGVAGCTALMVTGFGIRDSIQDIVGFQYGEITRYEYEVTFMDPPDEEMRNAFSSTARRYAGDCLFVLSQNVSLRTEQAEKNINLLTVPEGVPLEDFISLHRKEETLSLPGRGEALIDRGLADNLDLKAGDSVRFVWDEIEYTVTVSGVFDNYIYNYLLMSDETFEELTGTAPEKKTALVLLREGSADATARLLSADGVINVTAGSLLRDRIGSIMDNLIYIVLLTIICAAALAFIVIYNLININITERMREIATVRVLGFYREESAIYVLRENILLTGLGALLGIPLGILLNQYVMGAINVDLVTFEARVKFPSFIWSVGLTLLFSVFVYLIMMRKLEKINMAAALKAAE